MIPFIIMACLLCSYFADFVHVSRKYSGIQDPNRCWVQRCTADRCAGSTGFQAWRDEQVGRVPQEIPPWKGRSLLD